MSDTFPMNAWYAAAWEADVSRSLLARRVCGVPMVFYRKVDRNVVALRDACWHRLVPLSEGRLVDDNVMCGYHGLIFNPQGRCVHMPSQDTINPSACVRTYPVVERHRLVWVWTGDPALADPKKIPDVHWFDDPEWAAVQIYQYTRCDYRLVLDNLMDLTHETFLHAKSIGQTAIAEAPFELIHGDGRVLMTRYMKDVEAPPFFQLQHQMAYGRRIERRVDRWQKISYTAPETISIDVGVTQAGCDPSDKSAPCRINAQVLSVITPETDRTCHYFYGFAHSYAVDRKDITAELHKVTGDIIEDDFRIVEKQQQALDEADRDAIYNLNIDAGALWARRFIAEMVARERTRATLD